MKRLAIIGSGDLGQLIAEYAEYDNQYTVAGFFDDFRSPGDVVNGVTVLGDGSNILDQYKQGYFDCIIIAIAYKHFKERRLYFERFKGIIPFGNLIHSSAYIHPTCNIGEGIVILPGCVVDRKVVIEDNVLLHIGCRIIGGCRIAAHSFLSGGVAMAGFASVGQSCFVGVNVTIIDNITIGDEIKIGGGAVMIKSTDKKGWYVGNPARFLREY